MTNKEKYRQLCTYESSIPLFSRAWWLDATAGDEKWDVALVEKGDKIVAAMPYAIHISKKHKQIVQPSLTQTLGPWLRHSDSKYEKKLAQQKDFFDSLIDQLPVYNFFIQNWNYQQTNWLPFYWRGFNQMTLYTYILYDLKDEKNIWNGLRENIRTDIRKANTRHGLKVRTDLDVNSFLELNFMTFSRQDKVVPYTREYVKQLDKACADHNSRKIFIAEDNDGRHHAGVYIVWDKNSAHYLMGGSNPELRNSGATSLCLWEAIRYASTVTKQFDFEGSMIESVERFFRAFGAVQTPYFRITKTPSRALRAKQCLRSLLKGQ